MRKIGSGLAFALGASLALSVPQQASAQVPAALPDKESVAVGEATDADGTYVVSTINKRITIDRGRAYVVDPWNTALIFTVKSGMVTLQNFRQTGPDTFEADDLPMMGKVVFNRQPNGTLQGVVQGAMGEAKYALVPTDYAEVPSGGGPGGDSDARVAEQPRVYKLHVSGSRCEGKQLTRPRFRGVYSISIVDYDGDERRSRDRNFNVQCKDGGDRSQSYRFYDSGPGALTLTVPSDGSFSNMRVRGENKGGRNFDINRGHSSLLLDAINDGGALAVGQSRTDEVRLAGDKAKLYVTFTLERVQ